MKFQIFFHTVTLCLPECLVGVRGFHAREKQEGLVRAIVEGDLFFVGAFFFLCFCFLLSSFFLLLLSPRIVIQNKDLFRKK